MSAVRARRFVAVGGHSGLGLATLEHLFRTGFDPSGAVTALGPTAVPVQLVLLVRDPTAPHALQAQARLAALAAQNEAPESTTIELRAMDLADIRSIRAAAALLLSEGARIDTLWLNAAVAKPRRQLITDNTSTTTSSADTYEHTALVNHAGPLLFLDLVMPLLLDRTTRDRTKSRIVFTGSALHRNLSRDRPPHQTLRADFSSSALPNEHESSTAEPSSSQLASPAWSLRTSYANSKFLQVLGVQKFLRHLEQALAQRASASEGSNGEGRSWNEMEVVLVQPGFIPTTGLAREATFPTRMLTTYLLPNMPGTSSFVSTLEEGAEVLASALSWPLRARQPDEPASNAFAFAVEDQRQELAPANGWLGDAGVSPSNQSPAKALIVKAKVLQRPDVRTADIDLQDRWWPERLCGLAWINSDQSAAMLSSAVGPGSGGAGQSEHSAGRDLDEDGHPGGGGRATAQSQRASSSASVPTSIQKSGSAVTDAMDSSSFSSASPDQRQRRPCRPTVSEAATALLGLALSGHSELGSASELICTDGASAPAPKTPENLMQTSPLPDVPAVLSSASASAISLPSRTPPRRQASSPLSLYSTSADMLSVRRSSASALQPPKSCHPTTVIPATQKSSNSRVDEDATEELLDDSGFGSMSGTGTSSISWRHGSSRHGTPSPLSRRPVGPSWAPGYTHSPPSYAFTPDMPDGFAVGRRSCSGGSGHTGWPSPSASGSAAFSPSTASYTPSPFSRHPSISQSLARSASLSLIGSYDESLLSGRMSTMPSQPFDFDAELGVLGLASKDRECPRKLKCPKHLSVGFEARYYPLAAAASSDDVYLTSPRAGHLSPSSPSVVKAKQVVRLEESNLGSPYVGSIDLEAHFFSRLEQIMHSVEVSRTATIGASADLFTPAAALADVPVFPGYQVPPKGQIQLIVKNQNLTAVKVFLVKYDLSDMQPGTKTFIRQKSYVSTDINTDALLVSAGGVARQSPLAGQGAEKEAMRYAVHLQFACPPTSTACQPPAEAHHIEQGPASHRAAPRRGSTEPAFLASARDTPVPTAPPSPNGPARTDEDRLKAKPKVKKTAAPRIYLHRHIRVVFAATGLDSFERLDVVTECPGGVIPPPAAAAAAAAAGAGPAQKDHMYSAYSGPTDAWRRARRAVRRKLLALQEEVEAEATAAAAEAAALAREREREREREQQLLAELQLREEQEQDDLFDSAALDSSVHSAFGIPAPRVRSRPGSRRSIHALGGSSSADLASSERVHGIADSQHQATSGESSRAPSPSVSMAPAAAVAGRAYATPAPPPPPLLRRRRTLSRTGMVPCTVDENSVLPSHSHPHPHPHPHNGFEMEGSASNSSVLHSHHQHARRPGTSSSSASSSSFSHGCERDAPALSNSNSNSNSSSGPGPGPGLGASTDQDLLDSWHRSLLRRPSVSSGSQHGSSYHAHLSGSGLFSNASVVGGPLGAASAAAGSSGVGSPPGSPISAAQHAVWGFGMVPSGSASGLGIRAASRPTSPDPVGTRTLAPVQEASGAHSLGPAASPGSVSAGASHALLSQIQAQLLSLTATLARSSGSPRLGSSAISSLKNPASPSLSAVSPPPQSPALGTSTSTSTSPPCLPPSMPRLIRRISGAGQPASSSQAAAVGSASMVSLVSSVSSSSSWLEESMVIWRDNANVNGGGGTSSGRAQQSRSRAGSSSARA